MVEVRLSDEAFLTGVDPAWCEVVTEHVTHTWDLIAIDAERGDGTPPDRVRLVFRRGPRLAVIPTSLALLGCAEPAPLFSLLEAKAEDVMLSLLP